MSQRSTYSRGGMSMTWVDGMGELWCVSVERRELV